ncbi:MAG: methionyl-tRNA formyltransferase [Chloroflexi bacterium]|nr:methionyl-tRNA formyltransferase [Chloroflexota bacterium]
MTAERAGDDRARTIFLGTGGFGRASLRALHGHDAVRLVGIVSGPTRNRPSPVALVGSELGVDPILTPERLRGPGSIDAVLALEPDLLVLADYGQIVPAALLGLRHGALNLHPSLLPRHRGAIPIPAAILADDGETGVTLMRMDAGLDTGPIVAQERRTLAGSETAPQLEDALAKVAADLLDRTVGPWIRGELEAREQPADGATLSTRLRREDGRLDPHLPAAALERHVRALQPWPGSFVDTDLGRIVVWVARAELSRGAQPGAFDEHGLAVAGGERLALIEVQPAAGKRMSWEAFRRGRPGIVGTMVSPRP